MTRNFFIIISCLFCFYHSTWGQSKDSVKLVSYSLSSCDKNSSPYLEKIIDRIISENIHDDTLNLEIGFVQNCCHSRIPVVTLFNDTIVINLKQPEIEDNCTCVCCFSYSLTIKGLRQSKIVKFRGKVIGLNSEIYKVVQKPSYNIVGKDTFNLKDKYGLKQGIWLMGTMGDFMFYKDSRFIKSGKLYANHSIKSITDYDADTETEYYENGHKKKECINTKGKNSTCKYWDAEGNLTN